MEGGKLEISGRTEHSTSPPATYKQLPEEMEVKELTHTKINEPDGADEKMLPTDKDDTKLTDDNLIEVKFSNNEKQNGEAKLDIGEVKSEFVGMTKEELLKYANEPFWVRLRWFLFIGFWLIWAGMLVGAIMIIVAAPKCAPPQPKTWWEEGPLTHVDSSVTVEDLKDLQSKGFNGFIVDYPEDSYKLLNETDSFMVLLKSARETGVNVIVELNPTESDLWFEKSEAKDGEFTDYYIWAGTEGVREEDYPNNWLAKRSTANNKVPAWNYSTERKQHFLSIDTKPHLNLQVPSIIEAFSSILVGLLKSGAAGISLTGATGLLVDPKFENEAIRPASEGQSFVQDDYDFYTHLKTENLPGVGGLLKRWRDAVKNNTENGIFMLSDNLRKLDPYRINGTLVIDLPKHSNVFMMEEITAESLKDGLKSAHGLLEGAWPQWEINEAKNIPSDVLSVVPFLLKGTTVLNKDIKIDPDLKLTRKSPSILFGSEEHYLLANNTVFAYVRVHSGNPGYIVAINPTKNTVLVDFTDTISSLPEDLTVHYLSSNFNETGIEARIKTSSNEFPMHGESSVVLSYVPPSDE